MIGIFRLVLDWGIYVSRLFEVDSGFERIESFLLRQSVDFRRELLLKLDPGRVMSLLALDEFMKDQAHLAQEVAVVSGSMSEPELKILRPKRTQILSYEESPELFDLSRDWSQSVYEPYHDRFSLVLCEQVLEHLPDPKLAISNLRTIIEPGGFVHLSYPSINNRHGEPDFFYSGFAPEVVTLWGEAAGLRLVKEGSWNSAKGARMYATCDWSPLAVSGHWKFLLLFLTRGACSLTDLGRLLRARVRHSILYPFQKIRVEELNSFAVVSWNIFQNPLR